MTAWGPTESHGLSRFQSLSGIGTGNGTRNGPCGQRCIDSATYVIPRSLPPATRSPSPTTLLPRRNFLYVPAPPEVGRRGDAGVIDEDGDPNGYLFPADHFVPVELPEEARRMPMRDEQAGLL